MADWRRTLGHKVEMLTIMRFDHSLSRKMIAEKLQKRLKDHGFHNVDEHEIDYLIHDKQTKAPYKFVDFHYLWALCNLYKVSHTYLVHDGYNKGFTFQIPYYTKDGARYFYRKNIMLGRLPYSDTEYKVPKFLITTYICCVIPNMYQSTYDRNRIGHDAYLCTTYDTPIWIPFTKLIEHEEIHGQCLCICEEAERKYLIVNIDGNGAIDPKVKNKKPRNDLIQIIASSNPEDMSGTYAIFAKRHKDSLRKYMSPISKTVSTIVTNYSDVDSETNIRCVYGGDCPNNAAVLTYLGSNSSKSQYTAHINYCKEPKTDHFADIHWWALEVKKKSHKAKANKIVMVEEK